MQHAEAVAHEHVAECGQRVRERTALTVVLAGLAGVEADVLQHGHVAVGECVDRRAGRVAHGVAGDRDVGAEQLAEPCGHRRQGVRRVGCALGPAQVGHHRDPCTRVAQAADRRDAGADAAVVADHAVVERDVEVGAHQHALAAQVSEVVDRLHQRECVRALRATGRRAGPGR
jgi:hypothetical protein